MEKCGPIETPFKDAIFSTPGMSGDNVKQTNGADIRDGQAGTARTMPEVTTVSVTDEEKPPTLPSRKVMGIPG